MKKLWSNVQKIIVLLIISIFIILNCNSILLAVDYKEKTTEDEIYKSIEGDENNEYINNEQRNTEDQEIKEENMTTESNVIENDLVIQNSEKIEKNERRMENQVIEDKKLKFSNDLIEEAKTIEDGKYIIKSAINENYVFDIYDNLTTSGANLEIWRDNQGANQKFDVKYLGNGEYSIFASHSNKAIDVEGNLKDAGANVIQWASNNQDNQKWIIKSVGDGYYKIISKTNNLCLDIPYGEVKSGANVQVWTDNGGKNQMFKFEAVIDENAHEQEPELEPEVIGAKTIDNGMYTIRSLVDDVSVLDIYDQSKENGANLEIWGDNSTPNQKFNIKYMNDGTYTISAVHSGKYIDVEGASKVNGANVLQWSYNGNNNQRWIIRQVSGEEYNIISKDSGLYLTVESGNVCVKEANDTKSQRFSFNKAKIIPTKTIDNGIYKIRSLVDDVSVLDIYDQSKENGANLEIWGDNSTLNQKFNIKYMNDGTYTISAVHSGKYIDVEGASKENGANVLQWSYNGNNNQRWIISQASGEEYNIVSKDSGLFLSVDSGNVCVREQDNTKAQSFSFNKTNFEVENGTYGISGLKIQGNSTGSDLKYYKYGVGPNVFFATFAIHGWEDDFDCDGQELTKIANAFKDRLNSINDTSLANKWTIYIFPSVNPDGEYYGWSHNGPGRTTLYSDAPGHKGIDMNRTWSTDWVKYTSDRNYTGTEPFQAYEARYLRDFLLSHKSTNGQTVLVDLHGWLNETMGDDGISSYYRSQIGMTKHISTYGRGYLINWARAELNARSALIELPEAYSPADVSDWGLADKYINATINMLRGI